MHPELLLLSGQIAVLVLLASALAFGIAWWFRGSNTQALEEAQTRQRATEQQTTELKATLATTEQHCIAALEQRDAAELQAAHHAAEARRLLEAHSEAQREVMAQRRDHEQSLQDAIQLSEAKTREVTNELHTLREHSILKSEHEAKLTEAQTKLAQHERTLATLHEQQRQTASQLEVAITDLQKLRASTIPKAEHDTALNEALELATTHEAKLTSLTAQHAKATTELAAHQAQLAALQHSMISKTEHEAMLNEALELAASHETRLHTLTSELASVRIQLETLQRTSIAKTEHEALLHQAIEALEEKLASTSAEPTPATAPSIRPIVPSTPLPARVVTAPVVVLPKPAPPALAPLSVVATTDSEELSFPPAPALSTIRRLLFKGTDNTPRPPDAASVSAAEARLQEMLAQLSQQTDLVSTLTTQLSTETDQPALKPAKKKLRSLTEERDRLARHIEAVRRSVDQAKSPTARTDDLTLIKGVKDVLNKQLYAHGIFSYAQIANWTEADIQSFGELLAFKQRIHKDHWQDQARQLHEARYGESLKLSE